MLLERVDDLWVKRVAADQPVLAELPKIAGLAAGRAIIQLRQDIIGRVARLLRRRPSTRLSVSAIEKPVISTSQPRSTSESAPSSSPSSSSSQPA